jgi:CheY-like chemotaxis protein
MTNHEPHQAVILLAEDREDDVLLVRRALVRAEVKNPLMVVRNGEEVVAYLEGTGKYSNREHFPVPDLLLLDLKMPRMDGFEVLQWLRQHPEMKALRVIVLTSSQDIYDVNRAYELGANSFLVKPLEFENYAALTRTLAKFWFEQSKTPALAPEQMPETKG